MCSLIWMKWVSLSSVIHLLYLLDIILSVVSAASVKTLAQGTEQKHFHWDLYCRSHFVVCVKNYKALQFLYKWQNPCTSIISNRHRCVTWGHRKDIFQPLAHSQQEVVLFVCIFDTETVLSCFWKMWIQKKVFLNACTELYIILLQL